MGTKIDWKRAQLRLGVKQDGKPGPLTYAALFARLGPAAPTPIASALAAAAAVRVPAYGIDASVERLADFLAQGAHETCGWTSWAENMRYSAARIRAVWPSRFPTIASAAPFAWDPSDPDREDVALANRVYGDRMGNQLNGTADDDGWNCRGMGYLMLTGLANRHDAQARLGLDLATYPDLAADPATSLWIACDFYREHGVLTALDIGDLIGARWIVNAGTRHVSGVPVGWADVDARRAAALVAIGR
jgi:putative chitinase